MRWMAAGIVGLALLSTAPAVGAEETWNKQKLRHAQAHHRKGVAALQQGNYTKAALHLADAIEAVPEFPDAHLGLGHVATANKDHDTALREYQRARDGYLTMGAAMLQIHSERFAETQKKVNQLQDEKTYLQTSHGASKYSEGMIFRAITAIDEMIRQLEAVQPPDPVRAGVAPAEIDFYIGNALFHLDRQEEAIEAWERCRTGNPTFALVHNNLAVAYFKRGRFEDAAAELALAERHGFQPNPQFKLDIAVRTRGGSSP